MPPNRSSATNMATMVDLHNEILEPLKDAHSNGHTNGHVTPSITRNLSRETLTKLAEKETELHGQHVKVTEDNQLRPLHCAAQQYAWGRHGSSSTVARMKLAQAVMEGDSDFTIDPEEPYAELWLGTHPSGMSRVSTGTTSTSSSQQTTLLEYVQQDPQQHCGREEWTDLTFLLKVLSIEKVLSIQAHPDKKLAEKLHTQRPHIYKDPNHKPEMAICISNTMQAMCGFRPISEIAAHVEEYPEFRSILGDDVATQLQQLVHSPATRAVLQRMFQTYLECDDTVVQEQLSLLMSRLESMEEPNELNTLILQLAQQFPNDSGIIAPLMFNVVTLNKGQGLFIGANEPHAYISGELIECMACSDNVVRAGLTPKLKDVPTLVNMLTYKSQIPTFHEGHVIDECTTRYEPPVADFCVEMIAVEANQTYQLGELTSPSVLLCLSGSASLQQEDVCTLPVSFGAAAFCSAKTRATIVAGPEGVQLTRAFTNIYHDEYKYEGLEF